MKLEDSANLQVEGDLSRKFLTLVKLHYRDNYLTLSEPARDAANMCLSRMIRNDVKYKSIKRPGNSSTFFVNLPAINMQIQPMASCDVPLLFLFSKMRI